MKSRILFLPLLLLVCGGLFAQEPNLLQHLEWEIENGTITITRFWDHQLGAGFGSIAIPAVIDGKRVTKIGANAFSGSVLTSITIPGSVTSIEEYAFSGCHYLTSITIPGSVTSIGFQAFGYCSNLNSVTILHGVTSIKEGAFYDCTSLIDIWLPDSLTNIELGAFYLCDSLSARTVIDIASRFGLQVFESFK
jgi:hypothetical protein